MRGALKHESDCVTLLLETLQSLPISKSKVFPWTRRPYRTWPWFHHLPLCTFLTSLQAGCSLHTQRILLILPFSHSFHVKCSFHRQSYVSFPYFIQISAQMSPAQEAFSDFPTLRANSPTSSISLPFPSSVVVIELISLTHVQLNIITFTYSCSDCIPHSEVDEQSLPLPHSAVFPEETNQAGSPSPQTCGLVTALSV